MYSKIIQLYIYTYVLFFRYKSDLLSVLVHELRMLFMCFLAQFSSVSQSCPALCDSMDHSTPVFPVCPSPTPGACPNSCPSSRWCHPTISSPVASFSSCPQFFPASGSFAMSWLFTSVGNVLEHQLQLSPSNEYLGYISFRIEWFDLLAVQETLKSLLQHHNSKAS